MQRYFVEQAYQTAVDQGLSLIGEDYHHAVNVMRMKETDQCYLVFQDEVAIKAEVTRILPETVELKEVAREEQTKELPIHVTIACGYPKGDKLDLVVQKGTELGAHDFIGFPSQTSVVKWDGKKLAKRQDRLSKIAKEAAEQSHRQVQPTVTMFEQAAPFYESFSGYDQILVAYEEAAKAGEKARLVQTIQEMSQGQTLLVLIGPEGGFSMKEVSFFETLGAKICGLGPRILRAETAPLYLLSAISYQYDLLEV
ncbi:16S rRNA (uracil(1498)-N(3))-methyltransferase [uncultured Vagococcus sp.]|uniref:16S rRNA (uracil(1498)-N(3))-methyltransferase n=1 Tax=uncultured Vagococcus sp. TaxID=189676 RepID=UPI0028D1863C|nr:16S rRNA (uracil(1498)-N(3))-methyltransferase [uncultured Vagococcus sp.]